MRTGKIYTVDWTDYSATSTIVGWSYFTAKVLKYKKVGKTIFVMFNINGASNANKVTFTLPYSANGMVAACVYTVNNSVATTTGGCLYLPDTVSTVQVYKDMSFAAFNTSGTKQVSGQFWFECV
jgi:hypothetical protein